MAKQKYTVARRFTDKNGQPVEVGRQIEMEESEAQPRIDSGELTAVAKSGGQSGQPGAGGGGQQGGQQGGSAPAT